MRKGQRLFAFFVLIAFVSNLVPVVLACGPGYIEPVFVFERSPDLPFEQYTSGNIGIVRPTFGKKALVIAYRYLSGGGFNALEQKQLVDALRGKPPEDSDEEDTVKAWLQARKEVAQEEKPSGIYTERATAGGYNFFPNCTANAFEVAANTLRERVQSYGSDDLHVREWLKGQDMVFAICSSGSNYPTKATPDMPDWLKRDRAYQIAAAHFYALKFDEARAQFEEIAADSESIWKETAAYLVGRTLVRKASLAKDEAKKQVAYEEAERELGAIAGRGGRFGNAAIQLLNLVKFRIHPQERIGELSRTLTSYPGNDNVRQDLIDYVWLFDKFEAQVAEAIEEQKKKEREAEEARAGKKLNSNANTVKDGGEGQSEWEREREQVEKGEAIKVDLSYDVPGQTYPGWKSIRFDYNAKDSQILEAFESELGRELTEPEKEKVLEGKRRALEMREYYLGANYRYSEGRENSYPGGYSYDTDLTTDAFPEFMRADDLTDWIATFQVKDDLAYRRAVAKFKEIGSNAWLIAALAKANKESPEVEKLIADGIKLDRSSPAYPTAVYHSARLMVELGRDAEAGKLLDEIIALGIREFPVSSQNSLLELRFRVSKTLDEFIRFSVRKPVTFNNSGYEYGSLRSFYETEKGYWNKEYNKESQEEYLRNLEQDYAEILPWDDRSIFDDRTVDVFNRHFPLDLLAAAALSKELPEHLRPEMILTVWTRAVLLGRSDIANRFAGEGERSIPELSETFRAYLSIKIPVAKRTEELWILLKNPKLSAFVTGSVPSKSENEVSSWEDGWWVEPSDTYYDNRGNELPKSTGRPLFITARQSADAQAERRKIAAAGDAEEYLSRRVFAWANALPRDPRVQEALARVAVVNLSTKYGNGNELIRERAIELLETRYPNSPWIAKAKDEGY